MKELSFNEVQAVSATFKINGCSWLSPVDAIGFGVSLGGGYDAAFGAGGAATGTAAAMGQELLGKLLLGLAVLSVTILALILVISLIVMIKK